jgi:hypothetical protein
MTVLEVLSKYPMSLDSMYVLSEYVDNYLPFHQDLVIGLVEDGMKEGITFYRPVLVQVPWHDRIDPEGQLCKYYTVMGGHEVQSMKADRIKLLDVDRPVR